MTLNDLQRIAAEMRAEVQRNGRASRDLSGGLGLWLVRIGDEWMLTLQRDDTSPSEVEIQTVVRDFAVPAGAQRVSINRVTTFCWSERPQPAPMQQRLELV